MLCGSILDLKKHHVGRTEVLYKMLQPQEATQVTRCATRRGVTSWLVLCRWLLYCSSTDRQTIIRSHTSFLNVPQ